METKVFIKLLIWVILCIGVLELGTQAVSAQDTRVNICGVVLIAVFGFISYKTTCFTTIKTKDK